MTRRYGRAPIGTRLEEKTPCGRWETTTFLGALRAEGFVAPLTVDGAINGSLFLAWVQQHLAPTLQPGDVVVMDNLSSHKVAGVREAIESGDRKDFTTIESTGNIVFSQDGDPTNISLLGVDNLIVVRTGDALLVADKNKADHIKKLIELLPSELH